jgi:hypothetical protein
MYMLAAGAAAGAMNAIASLKDLFAPSSSPSQTGLAPTDPFSVATGANGASSTPATGASWNCMTAETMSAMISVQSQASDGTAPQRGGRATEYFAMLDTNTDGSVSKDELQSALTPSGNADKTDALFSKLDANNDGSVSQDELKKALRASHHHHHAPVDTGETSGADSASDQSGPLSNATSQTVTNSDGSTTTTISYADGSSVSMTQSAAAAINTNTNTNTFANNLLERLIQRQAQMLAATTAGQGLSVSA